MAYIVPAPGQRVIAGELRGFMLRKVPDYMLPAAFLTALAEIATFATDPPFWKETLRPPHGGPHRRFGANPLLVVDELPGGGW